MILKTKNFKTLLWLFLEFTFLECNLIVDAHKMSDGRADDYKQRKCFVECMEKKVLLYPDPDPNQYFKLCLLAYTFGCPN
ncbi:hypothetical protein JWG45_08035 [Leptospira sp. 201903070]|uniref:Uncharacterized protein n=1 Tax=Leptospira ainlahdjerensis TaxID=2810033 RepID=A0ABS2U9R1_9LEPT|nr:hypothetical protein [Leptospira ainlahdjerensis]MBM9577102.1 hypothetical protein [Leptospira ainlahdjerensis]